MDGWKEIRIKEIGDVVTGNTPPRKRPELYGNHTLFVKPTDISTQEKYCYKPEECYSKLGFDKYKKSLIPKNSTCVVTIGSIGQKMIMSHTELFINQAMNAIIPNENYDKHFVYYLLKLNLFQLKVFDSGTASGRENVSKSSFSNIKVIVPESKEIQRKIAAILSAYDDLIENNLKRINLLEEKAQLTYEEWFVRMKFPDYETTPINEKTDLPEGWEKGKIFDLFELQRGFDLPVQKRQTGLIPVIASTGIIDYHDVDKVKGPGIVTGRSGTIGKVLFVKNDFWPLNTTLWVKKYKKGNPTFALQFLRSIKLKRFAGGSAVPSLDRKVVHHQSINVPNVKLIQKFETYCTPILSVIKKLQNQNQLLKEARDILLPRLMTGMIDVEQMA